MARFSARRCGFRLSPAHEPKGYVRRRALFASRSAPFVVGMISTLDNPVRLIVPADLASARIRSRSGAWRHHLVWLGASTARFGCKACQCALKAGTDGARPRMMQALIAVQVDFCFVVLFLSELFLATFNRLSRQPNGFSSDRILTLETLTTQPQPAVLWRQVAEQLRAIKGVEAVADRAVRLQPGLPHCRARICIPVANQYARGRYDASLQLHAGGGRSRTRSARPVPATLRTLHALPPFPVAPSIPPARSC